jgi:hypothetical protein
MGNAMISPISWIGVKRIQISYPSFDESHNEWLLAYLNKELLCQDLEYSMLERILYFTWIYMLQKRRIVGWKSSPGISRM